MKKSDDSDLEFLDNYRHNLFKTTKNNLFESVDAERKCISEMFRISSNKMSTNASCSLLDDMLGSYTDSIDDQNGINNYADQLKSLTSNLNELQCSQWKSNLHNDISEFIEPLSCGCERIKTTEDDFNVLFRDENINVRQQNRISNNDDQQIINNVIPIQKLGNNFSLNQNKIVTNTSGDNFQTHQEVNVNQNKNYVSNHSKINYASNQSKINYVTNQNKINYISDQSKINYVSDQSKINYVSDQNKINYVSNQNRVNFQFKNENQVRQKNKNPSECSDKFSVFKTAKDELRDQNLKKYGNSSGNNHSNGVQKKSLGIRRGVQSKFVPPTKIDPNEDEFASLPKYHMGGNSPEPVEVDERLKNIDPRMVELIRSEIMDSGALITWDDIAGLEFAKTAIKEAVVWPLLRPDIFTGLRRPPKGILLFGPPGTGKTLIGKCIASQSQSTFFSISASSLTSKWIGEGEKMVRAMFAVARCHQPAVIFIDEVDSLLSQRSETEHESSRRIKTEFLVQLDGAATADDDRILLVGATNRPQELDEAARRRFVKRLYIPLPEKNARLEIVERLMNTERNNLSSNEMERIADMSDGFSGADMKNLCSEASLGPIRSIDINQIQNIEPNMVRPVTMQDFETALKRVRASVSSSDLDQYLIWDKTYGSGGV